MKLRDWFTRRVVTPARVLSAVELGLGNMVGEMREVTKAIRDLQFWWVRREKTATVTVLVMGKGPENPMVPQGVMRIASATKVLKGDRSEVVEVENYWPLHNCVIVALVDVDRVQVDAISFGPNVVSMGSPVAYYEKTWDLGIKLRVFCRLREELGGK